MNLFATPDGLTVNGISSEPYKSSPLKAWIPVNLPVTIFANIFALVAISTFL